jgi:hypothetical protein
VHFLYFIGFCIFSIILILYFYFSKAKWSKVLEFHP